MTDYSQNMRACFGKALLQLMDEREDVYLLLGDLGYGIFDEHLKGFPTRALNVGAAEQAMMDMAVGLTYEGKTVFVYSITPFLLFRPFETIRTYVSHEKLPIILVGSGRGDDYKHDGFSHYAGDDENFIPQTNVEGRWPFDASDITTAYLKEIIETKLPIYLNLKR